MATAVRPAILAVDDEPGVLESFRLIFEDDYDVISATDGKAALAALESRLVDLVLLDLVMPGMNGLATLTRVRAMDPDVPVVVVTALSRSEPTLEAIRLGANDYVTKPFDEAHLSRVVKAALAGRAARAVPSACLQPAAPRVLLVSADLGTRAALTVALNLRWQTSSVPTLSHAVRQLGQCVPVLVVADLRGGAGEAGHAISVIRGHLPGGHLVVILPEGGLLTPSLPEAPARGFHLVTSAPLDFDALLNHIALMMPAGREEARARRFSPHVARVVHRVALTFESVTVCRLADMVGLSEGHLSRVFHEEMGITLKDFIVRVRMEAAKCLLAETRHKTHAIAHRVGLYDGSHLSRTFRLHGAGPPGMYR